MNSRFILADGNIAIISLNLCRQALLGLWREGTRAKTQPPNPREWNADPL